MAGLKAILFHFPHWVRQHPQARRACSKEEETAESNAGGPEYGLRTRRLAEGGASILEMKNVDSKVPNLRRALVITQ